MQRHLGDPFFGVTLNPGHLIHLDGWIALLAGALFAVVLNMRSVSTMLGSEHQLTLIDRLRIVVLADIVVATAATILASIAHDRGRPFTRRPDYICCGLIVLSFAAIDALLVALALAPAAS